jgi:hypothetical protein
VVGLDIFDVVGKAIFSRHKTGRCGHQAGKNGSIQTPLPKGLLFIYKTSPI